MNLWDVILIIAIAALVAFAIYKIVKRKRAGGCGCGCSSGSCEGCRKAPSNRKNQK